MSGQAAVRIKDVFERTRAEGRAALVGYLPVGYPDVDASIAAMVAMVEAGADSGGAGGADIVEIGVPYSDPVMDGPVIQQATATALAQGFRVADVFRVVRAVAAVPAPSLTVVWIRRPAPS